jgi:hypothetical protein
VVLVFQRRLGDHLRGSLQFLQHGPEGGPVEESPAGESGTVQGGVEQPVAVPHIRHSVPEQGGPLPGENLIRSVIAIATGSFTMHLSNREKQTGRLLSRV